MSWGGVARRQRTAASVRSPAHHCLVAAAEDTASRENGRASGETYEHFAARALGHLAAARDCYSALGDGGVIALGLLLGDVRIRAAVYALLVGGYGLILAVVELIGRKAIDTLLDGIRGLEQVPPTSVKTRPLPEALTPPLVMVFCAAPASNVNLGYDGVN
jgi:hypothetical protein